MTKCKEISKLKTEILFLLKKCSFGPKFVFFSIHIRNYIHKLQIDKLLYNTTMTIPGGAKYHDYPMAFKVPLWSKTK